MKRDLIPRFEKKRAWILLEFDKPWRKKKRKRKEMMDGMKRGKNKVQKTLYLKKESKTQRRKGNREEQMEAHKGTRS